MSTTLGRNDPWAMIVLGAVVLLGLVFMTISLIGGGGESACPPGQSWSAAHGHCH